MIFPVLALIAGLPAPVARDTTTDTLAVYAAVLTDVRARVLEFDPHTDVILDEAISRAGSRPPWPPMEYHRPETAAHLRAGGWIQGACRRGEASNACITSSHHRRLIISLGPVIGLPDTTRIPLKEPYLRSGAPVDSQARVAVGIAVDVVLDWPCSAPCRNPSIAAYRYFLRQVAPGRYEVVTRWITGAA
ncbi:MAG TPA: hypothetical protein VFH27_09920 [Longimicrobiaceae bacterium]|nr:hypothetical protein [Longimicrobiaceae bacterium]